MWTILLRILASWAWSYLVPFFFELLRRKFGSGLIDFVYQLIGDRSQEIMDGKITADDAEKVNLKLIMDATKNSPGLSITWARMIHTLTYMKWVKDNIETKFEWWLDAIMVFEWTGKNKTTPDYMDFYLSRPDQRK